VYWDSGLGPLLESLPPPPQPVKVNDATQVTQVTRLIEVTRAKALRIVDVKFMLTLLER
jgi:hypothetical protein